MPPLPWYALHVASNQEEAITDRLDQAEIESYYPHRREKSADGRRGREIKYFPGYLFARFDLAASGPVIRIPQVIRILGIGITPVEIPDPEIAAVRLMTSVSSTVSAHPFIAIGSPVVIKCGPLQGLEGLVVHTRGALRVVVSVTFLQRALSAEVAAADLAPRPVRAS